MRIPILQIVMDMGGLDVRTQDLKRFRHAAHEVSMAEVEADANIAEMRTLDQFYEFVRRREVIRNVFKQNVDTERLSERPQVFDGRHGCFKLMLIEGVVAYPQMLNEKAKRNLLGNFECALDLIHCLDASRSIRGSNIQRRSPGATEFIVGKHRGMNRMKRDGRGTEPVSNFAYMLLAVRVIDVLASSADFNRLRSGAHQSVEQPWMETLFDVQQGRNCFLH